MLAATATENDDDSDGGGGGVRPLPPELKPYTMAVFSQMLGEGIALSSLPLYLTHLGASPLTVGLAISCFSVMQMLLCPLLVALSSAIGDRETILRVCLLGATMSGVLLSLSNSVYQIIFARLLAGAFAASVPVAQAAVTDVVTGNATAAALARVSAAAQSGVVAGPAVAAFLLPAFGYLGVPSAFRLRCVFALSSSLALGVLALSSRDVEVRRARRSRRPKKLLKRMREERAAKAAKAAAGAADRGGPAARLTQPVLRLVAVLIGWSLTLSVSTYGLFAPRFLGFAQPQLSASYSAGAAVTLGVQLALFPRLVSRFGAHLVATAGLLSVSGAMASMVVCRAQPWHSALYLLNRASSGVADTSVATLVALGRANAREAHRHRYVDVRGGRQRECGGAVRSGARLLSHGGRCDGLRCRRVAAPQRHVALDRELRPGHHGSRRLGPVASARVHGPRAWH